MAVTKPASKSARPAAATAKAGPTPGPKLEPKPEPKPRPARAGRRPASGDIAPSSKPAGIKSFVVKDRSAAARDSKIEAIHDIVAHAKPGEGAKLAQALTAVVEGASPDDVEALKNALLQSEVAVDQHPDEELAPGWREGGYPYRR
jgi:hypothetical protein